MNFVKNPSDFAVAQVMSAATKVPSSFDQSEIANFTLAGIEPKGMTQAENQAALQRWKFLGRRFSRQETSKDRQNRRPARAHRGRLYEFDATNGSHQMVSACA